MVLNEVTPARACGVLDSQALNVISGVHPVTCKKKEMHPPENFDYRKLPAGNVSCNLITESFLWEISHVI